MAKKNQPIPAQKYIKQPYPLSTLASDLSLQQTHILVEMMDSVSTKIGEMFESGSKLLFKEEDFADGIAHIDVDFRALTNRPDCYRDVESVARKMISTQMEFTEEKEDGPTKTVINAFESVEIPMDGNRRQGVIRFNLTKRQATSLFDFTRYSKYIKSVARNTSSVYTARIYMLITAWRKLGQWTADYEELRKSLGCNEYNKTTKEWEQKKYKEYRQFKRRVLKTAEDELRMLAENGEVDCFFDFKEVYKDGKVSAQPISILFTIYTTEMGKEDEKHSNDVKRYYELQAEIKSLFSLTDLECRQVLSKVDDDMVKQFTIRVHEIAKSIERQGDKIKDKRKYALKCLYDAVLEFTPQAEEVVESKVEGAVEAGEVLTQDTFALSDADKEWWSGVVSRFAGTPIAIPLEGMELVRNEKGLHIEVPTNSFLATFGKEVEEVKKYTKLDIAIKN